MRFGVLSQQARSKPMISHINDAIERTRRLIGMPREEIVRRRADPQRNTYVWPRRHHGDGRSGAAGQVSAPVMIPLS
jgi:hypothetical protein